MTLFTLLGFSPFMKSYVVLSQLMRREMRLQQVQNTGIAELKNNPYLWNGFCRFCLQHR